MNKLRANKERTVRNKKEEKRRTKMGTKVNLISGRTIVQGQNLDNKLSEKYFDEVATCEMSKEDLERLGVAAGDSAARVKVRTSFGEVVVKAKENAGTPAGIAFIPMGPWANAVVSGETHGAGMPSYKGIDAEVEKTEEEVLRVKELMQTYKE